MLRTLRLSLKLPALQLNLSKFIGYAKVINKIPYRIWYGIFLCNNSLYLVFDGKGKLAFTRSDFHEGSAFPILQHADPHNNRIFHRYPLRENRSFCIFQVGGCILPQKFFSTPEVRQPFPWLKRKLRSGRFQQEDIYGKMVCSWKYHRNNGTWRKHRRNSVSG